MWQKLLFYRLVVVAAVLLLGVVASSSNRRDRDVIGYNVLSERVFEGAVESKPYLVGQIVYFPLRTTDAVVHVQLGPKDFVERSHFRIKAGDMVIVTGMPAVLNGRNVVLAQEVRNGNAVLLQLILFHRRLFRLSFDRAPLQNGKLFHHKLTPEDVGSSTIMRVSDKRSFTVPLTS